VSDGTFGLQEKDRPDSGQFLVFKNDVCSVFNAFVDMEARVHLEGMFFGW